MTAVPDIEPVNRLKGASCHLFKRLAIPIMLTIGMPIMTQSTLANIDSSVSITPSPVKVKDYTTPLGISGWHVETPDIPVLTISLCFRNAGDQNDPDDQHGLTEFLCGMLDEGAGSYNSVSFKALLLEKNVRLSVAQNSDSVFVTLRSTKSNINDLFEILTLILNQPRFDIEALERVREQILTSLQQSLHSENQIVSDTFNQQAFKGHPYGRSVKSEITGVKKVKKADLQQYMKDRFGRDQINVTSAGDISLVDLEKYIDKCLKNLPETAKPSLVKDIEPAYTGDITVVPMDIPQSVILFYQPGVSRKDPNFYTAYVLDKILGDGGFKSRLWDEVRENRGLAYGIDCDLRWVQHAYYMIGSTATSNENAGKVIEIIRAEWEKMKSTGATQEELDFVKERLTGAYPLGFSSTPKIVGLLNNYQQDNLGADFINKRNDLIRNVTLTEVNTLAKSLIQPDKLSFVIVGKPEGLPESKGTKK